MHKTIVIMLAFWGFSSLLIAQGGSNYSVFGIGDLHHGIGAAYDGIGGTSIAVPFHSSLTNRNPAQWSFIKTTRLQAGYRFNQQIVENEKMNLWQNNGKIDGFIINFGIDTASAINLNIGISTYSSVNYFVSFPIEVELGNGTLLNGRTAYQGIGGLSQGWIGGSYKPASWLALGASMHTYFGNIQSSSSTLLYNSNSSPTRTVTKDVFSGYGYRLGVLVEPLQKLYLGAYTELNNDMSLDRFTNFQAAYLNDSIITDNFSFQFPNLYGVGLSYTIGNVVVASDYITQNFSNFQYNRGDASFTDYKAISFGVARLGLFGFNRTFFDRTTYMIGGGYKEKNLSIKGTNINEYYMSVGISAPLVGFAVLDASLTFGSLGTVDFGLLRESFGRLNVSLSLGDAWFQPFKREF